MIKMKTAKLALVGLSIALLMAFPIAFSTQASGASIQWFPSKGTNCDYEISLTIQYKNNTIKETNLFDAYIAPTIVVIVPSIFHFHPIGFFTSNKNNTPVIWRNSYNEIPGNQLNRTTSIIVNNIANPATQHVLIYDSNFSLYQENTDSVIFQKNSYYLALLDWNFLDYFNCSARIGEIVQNSSLTPPSKVYGITDSQIFAMYNVTGPADVLSRIYNADKTGRVTQLSFLQWAPAFFAPLNANSVFVNFIATSQTSPDYMPYIIYAVIGGVCIVVGLLIGFAVGKSKRK